VVARLVEEVGREYLAARNLGKGEMGAGQCDGDRTRRRVAKIIGKGPRGIVSASANIPPDPRYSQPKTLLTLQEPVQWRRHYETGDEL